MNRFDIYFASMKTAKNGKDYIALLASEIEELGIQEGDILVSDPENGFFNVSKIVGFGKEYSEKVKSNETNENVKNVVDWFGEGDEVVVVRAYIENANIEFEDAAAKMVGKKINVVI